ncbi:hypothetical protein [Marinobacter sp. CA1]|uniref:hypothetical protein n=1 Tax=Marinobacter sp. CA1 TaxID=2817656 RepID=UPI001D06B7AD|nr:hypothetical protein [Pseudomonadales bacterium]UDL06119.1 hypothetical protein J2887_04995 [Marinobacter sp. CA1]
MTTRLTVRSTIIVVTTTAIAVVAVFVIIFRGNSCPSCCADGTAENSAISATYLITDGSPNGSAYAATQRGVDCIIGNGTQ